MAKDIPKLSPEQWEFLAVFDALDQPIAADVGGALVPLPPGPF